jgi:hypothetical protein
MRTWLSFVFLAPILAIAATRGSEGGPAAVDLEAAKSIRAEDLKRDLTYLASDELEGRATPSEGQRKAAEFLAKRFQELGLEPGGTNGSYKQTIAFQPRAPRGKPAPESAPAKVDVYNVIGILRGADVKAGAVVFTAHYDHIGRGKKNAEGDDIYNGADDDGSGTVSVLALAKAFAKRKERPKRTLVFACFTGEEIGGVGSKAYVKLPVVKLEETICDVNLEMLGRSFGIGKGKAWLTGWEFSTLGPILARGAKSAGVDLVADPYPQENYYVRSDNVAFIRQGVIGQTVSAGSTHPDYHGLDDEADRIEYENLEQLVRGIYLGASLIATGAETPKATGDSLLPEFMRQRDARASRPASAPAK